MKKKINVTIDEDLPEKIKQEMKEESRSKSGVVNHALRKYFDKDGSKKKKKDQ